MAYFTKASLKQYADHYRYKTDVQRNILRKAMTDSVQARVFLSHSHADLNDLDDDTLKNIFILLSSLGFELYIDSLDATMPEVTNAKTANQIRDKIVECDKFVLVATNNAINSKWVPWELGYADGKKSLDDIAILPIADTQGVWNGSEYLRLYPRIQEGSISPLVYDRNGSYQETLKQWVPPPGVIRRYGSYP